MGAPWQFATEEMKGDRQIVIKAVSQNGFALKHATEEMKGDREVVMTAVSKNGYALAHATEEMKGDREIVMPAVSEFGHALWHAPAELRGDADMIVTALANRKRAPLVALRVSLLSGRFCNQIFNTSIHDMEDVLQQCADLLES